MFTGIVITQGQVSALVELDGARRISIDAEPTLIAELGAGDSIAVDGVCQTVVGVNDTGFTVEAIGTTLSRTTFAEFQQGRRVNLELALGLGERLGGHLVQGHVDAVGRVLAVEHTGEHVLVDVSLPEVVAEVTVLHGSIAIDGVSLTVNAMPTPDSAQVALIPYTWSHTNMGRLQPGSNVNLEGDMLGRFVVHYLKRRGGQQS
jgi:riboflavin synthase